MLPSRRVKTLKVMLGIGLGLAALVFVVGLESRRAPVPAPGFAANESIPATQTVSEAVQTKAGDQVARKPVSRREVEEVFSRVPLTFEKNVGQTDASVRFMTRGRGFVFFLTDEGTVMCLQREVKTAEGASLQPKQFKRSVLRVRYEGANATPKVVGLEEQAGKSNYYIGNDPEKWTTNVPHFARVRYDQIYPGIDLVHYGVPGALEHDFIVKPGADPYAINMSFEGLVENQGRSAIEIDKNGNLVLQTADGSVRMHAPVSFQERCGKRTLVPSRYVLKENNRVGFQVAAYDSTRSLTIDPVLGYSTYLGGSGADACMGITVDANDNALVTGSTTSANFPTAGKIQSILVGTQDAFLTKLNKVAGKMEFSVYIGGTGNSAGRGVVMGDRDEPHLCGTTTAEDFPTLNGFQLANGGGVDAFILRLDKNASLKYGSYFGGSGDEVANMISMGKKGNAYIVGSTTTSDFHTYPERSDIGMALLPAVQKIYGGGATDGFVFKANMLGATGPNNPSLIFLTHVGGSGADTVLHVDVDAAESAYVIGYTDSADLPVTSGVLQGTLGGGSDAFVAKLVSTGASYTYSTYLGGSADETGAYAGITVDENGQAIVVGTTASADFPVANAFQGAIGGGNDAFLASVNSGGTALVYSTFFGGSGNDQGHDVAYDAKKSPYIAGTTASTNFPTFGAPIQTALNGGDDVFITKFEPVSPTMALEYSTYLGGSGTESEAHLAVSTGRTGYVAGTTTSSDMQTTDQIVVNEKTGTVEQIQEVQPNSAGGTTEGFVSQISRDGEAGTATSGADIDAVLTGDNTAGPAPLTVTFYGLRVPPDDTPQNQSRDPDGAWITSYIWDFGDGSAVVVTPPPPFGQPASITHTYAAVGNYNASLQVQNNVGDLSQPAFLTVVVGDTMVTDVDLALVHGTLFIDAKVEKGDRVTFKGFLNPAGLPPVTGNIKVNLKLNGNSVNDPIAVPGRPPVHTPEDLLALINPKTGLVRVAARGIKLKDKAGIGTLTKGRKVVRMQVELEITDTPMDTANYRGVVDVRVKTKAKKNSRGEFIGSRLPTYTGYFKSVRTMARARGGGHAVTSSGLIQPEFGGPLTPTGDVTLTIGGDGGASAGTVITIPLSSLRIRGAGDKSRIVYTGGVAELKKFEVNNGKHSFKFQTNALTGTGIPAAGGGDTEHDLRIVLVVPTAVAPMTFTTIVEVKRDSNASGDWER